MYGKQLYDMQDKLRDAASTVHYELGEGFSESVYHSAFARELSERGIPFHSEGTISVFYKGAPVGRRRPDLFIISDDGLVVVELKAGSSSGEAQLQQYLDLTTASTDLGNISGGAVIRFNDKLEFEYFDTE